MSGRIAGSMASEPSKTSGVSRKGGGLVGLGIAAGKSEDGGFASLTLEALKGMEAAATRVQSMYRGRVVRQKVKMSQADADALWYETITPVVHMHTCVHVCMHTCIHAFIHLRYKKIKPVVHQVFDQIAGGDQSVSEYVW